MYITVLCSVLGPIAMLCYNSGDRALNQGSRVKRKRLAKRTVGLRVS
jgi:hypothetical protein